MKPKLPIAILVLVLVLVLLGPPSQRVVAAEAQTLSITLAELGYVDETVQGVLVNRTYSVNFPSQWTALPENTLTLRFSHSPALDVFSAMAVDWNGVRLTSVMLTPENIEGGSVTFTIPADIINKGYNQLTLQFYMGISGDYCQDDDNPAVWATIHATSSLNFTYEVDPPVVDLAVFPQVLFNDSPLVKNTITLILPDQPTSLELNALASVSAKLGQLANWRAMELNGSIQSSGGPMGNIIVVGRIDRLGMFGVNSMPFVSQSGGVYTLKDSTGTGIPGTAGVIWEQVSPFDPTSVMILITGATDEGTLLAAQAFSNSATYSQFSGQQAVILSLPEPVSEDLDFGKTYTFADLGYVDETAEGTREQTITYNIRLPMNWASQSEVLLELHFSHSELIASNKSSLNILVNNTPVSSFLLTPSNANLSWQTIRLPTQLFGIGDNSLKITGNIKIDKDYNDPRYCLDNYNNEAWVVIYADSRFTLPGGPTRMDVRLIQYPFAFMGSSNLSGVTFVVPDHSDSAVVQSLSQITARLGRYATGTALTPRVVDASTLPTLSSIHAHQILIGLPAVNPAITDLNDILPLPFTPGTNQPLPSDQIIQMISVGGSVGFIEATSTDDGQTRLVVTGNDSTGLLWATEGLTDPAMIAKLDGDLVILNAQGSIASYNLRQQAITTIVVTATPELGEPVTRQPVQWVLIISLAAIFLSVVALVIIIMQRASRKTRQKGQGK